MTYNDPVYIAQYSYTTNACNPCKNVLVLLVQCACVQLSFVPELHSMQSYFIHNMKIFKRKLKILLEQQAAIIDEIEDIEILD